MVTTMLATAAPLAFWKRVRGSYPVRKRRLLLFVIGMLVACYCSLAAGLGYLTWRRSSTMQVIGTAPMNDRLIAVAHATVLPLSQRINPALDGPPRESFLRLLRPNRNRVPVGGLLITGMCPMAAFVALRLTRRRVRLDHLGRIASYGTSGAVAAILLSSADQCIGRDMLPGIDNHDRFMVLSLVAWETLWWAIAIRCSLGLPYRTALVVVATLLLTLIPAGIILTMN